MIYKKIKYIQNNIDNCPVPVYVEWDMVELYGFSIIDTYKLGIYEYLKIE